jgi:hypothetical protein
MTVAPQPAPGPGDEARHAAQHRLERAVGEGRLTLDEFTDRAERVWGAETDAAIEQALDGLPVPVVGQTEPARSTLVSLIGDIRRRGRWSLRRRTSAYLVIGDVELDLRGAVVAADGTIEIRVLAVIGDVEVTVPAGVEVELGGLTLLGDRRVDLAPVPRVPGTPTVRVSVYSLIGDTKIRSST